MIKSINNDLQIRTWKHVKIVLTLIGAIFILDGCSNKINQISSKESYKILDEMAIYVKQNNSNIRVPHTSIAFTGYPAFPITPVINYKPVTFCEEETKLYLSDITNNVSKFQELLKDKNIKIKNMYEPTNKLLFIDVIQYNLKNIKTCEIGHIYIDVYLYDVEDISQHWHKDNSEKIDYDILRLDKNRIIYKNTFLSDKYFNSFPAGQFSSDFLFNKSLNKM